MVTKRKPTKKVNTNSALRGAEGQKTTGAQPAGSVRQTTSSTPKVPAGTKPSVRKPAAKPAATKPVAPTKPAAATKPAATKPSVAKALKAKPSVAKAPKAQPAAKPASAGSAAQSKPATTKPAAVKSPASTGPAQTAPSAAKRKSVGQAAKVKAASAKPTEPAAEEVAPQKESVKKSAKKPAKKSSLAKRIVLFTALGLFAIAALVAFVFSWDRWMRYDDVADIQGSWAIADTQAAVAIDEETIRLTDDVAYHYILDPGAKTISFSFGSKSGFGHYRFSDDRQQLVIYESDNPTAFSTLISDIAWKWDGMVRAVQGESPAQPEASDSVSVYERSTTPTA